MKSSVKAETKCSCRQRSWRSNPCRPWRILPRQQATRRPLCHCSCLQTASPGQAPGTPNQELLRSSSHPRRLQIGLMGISSNRSAPGLCHTSCLRTQHCLCKGMAATRELAHSSWVSLSSSSSNSSSTPQQHWLTLCSRQLLPGQPHLLARRLGTSGPCQHLQTALAGSQCMEAMRNSPLSHHRCPPSCLLSVERRCLCSMSCVG